MLSEDLSNSQAGPRWKAHYIVTLLSRLEGASAHSVLGYFAGDDLNGWRRWSGVTPLAPGEGGTVSLPESRDLC
jgi:hypothetical protein